MTKVIRGYILVTMEKDKVIDNEDLDVGDADVSEGDKPLSKLEMRRRNRSVRVSKAIFRTIDILFAAPQNACPYVTKDNMGSIENIKDVVYDNTLPTVCKLDVYRVKSDDPQPAIILIHGGGFAAGQKKYRRGQSQYFALNGFTVFCVDYGLAPDYSFPSPLIHLVNAANYVHANAQLFNIDKDRIFVAGDSAGGYYAAMLAAFNGNDRFKKSFGVGLEFDIFGALLNCGLYDMQTVFNTKYLLDIDESVLLSLTGIVRKEFENFEYRDVCMPLDFITEKFPPSFVIYSDKDLFCKGQGNVLLEKLQGVGVYYESYASRHPTSNHCFSLTWRGEDATAANELMMSFAKRLANDRIKL